MTKINSKIISKPHAQLQTMEKTCAKFQKDWYKIVWRVALTRYPLYIHFHRIWGQKMTKFTKWKKWQKWMQGLYPNQTMMKTFTKFQKDRYKIVWGVALTRYPLSIHQGRKMTKFTKWNNLTIISKPHAHPHTMKKTPAKFQKDGYKTVIGVAHTHGKCWWMDRQTDGQKLACLSHPC